MTQRFGGRYSPDGDPTPMQLPKRSKTGLRANAMFVLPLPLALIAFFRPLGGLALTLLALGILLGAAWMLREGLRAQEAYDARNVSRPPALPRKLIAAALCGLGIAVAAIASGAGVLSAGLAAILGSILHGLAFGLDPMTAKGLGDAPKFQTERVLRHVAEAEAVLAEMMAALAPLNDPKLDNQAEAFADTARAMFRQVEDDPRDLPTARKYLGVYLRGARDATAKFADHYVKSRDPKARADFTALLDELTEGFATRTKTMLTDSRSDLDVEIEVLRDRLAREGVRLDPTP